MEEEFTEEQLQRLRIENQQLKRKLAAAEEEHLKVAEEAEKAQNKFALAVIEHKSLNEELQKEKNLLKSYTKSLNDWDGSVQQPLQHYKDMKRALESYTSTYAKVKKLYSQMDAASSNVEKLKEEKSSDIVSSQAMHDHEIKMISSESKATIAKLQTQLKLFETQRKSLECQLSQKTEQNQELTKICEELISQRS